MCSSNVPRYSTGTIVHTCTTSTRVDLDLVPLHVEVIGLDLDLLVVHVPVHVCTT